MYVYVCMCRKIDRWIYIIKLSQNVNLGLLDTSEREIGFISLNSHYIITISIVIFWEILCIPSSC